MPPFCGSTCPRQSGKCDRWHKSCFRCPVRKVYQQTGNWRTYHFDDALNRFVPIDMTIFSLFIRYDFTIIFYSNDKKALHSVKDCIMQGLLNVLEKHNKLLLYPATLKLCVQVLEELCK